MRANFRSHRRASRFSLSQQADLLPSDPDECDPYLKPGYLTTNPRNIAANFWTPFDRKCPRAPHFLQDVIDRKPLPWLQGKTLLMIGDSIERNNLRYFCELVNSTNLRTTHLRNLDQGIRLGNTINEHSDLTRPRICRIEEYNFEIISYFNYGMQDEEIWTDLQIYTPPGLFERRIWMMDDLVWNHEREPDIILLASGNVVSPTSPDCRFMGFSRMGQGGCI